MTSEIDDETAILELGDIFGTLDEFIRVWTIVVSEDLVVLDDILTSIRRP